MTTTHSAPAAPAPDKVRPDRRGAIDGLPDLRLPAYVLVGLLLFRTAALFLGDALIAVIARLVGHDVMDAMIYVNAVIVAVDVATVALLAWVLRRRHVALRAAIGPIRLRRDLLLALPVSLLLLVAFVVASYVADFAVYGGPPPVGSAGAVPLWLGVWSITIMPVTVAVAEEILYRGVLLHALRTRFGAVAAVLISSFFFGLQHAALSLGTPADMIARVLTTFLCGIVFAVLALKLRRLLPLIIGHWVIDVLGLGLPMLFLALR